MLTLAASVESASRFGLGGPGAQVRLGEGEEGPPWRGRVESCAGGPLEGVGRGSQGSGVQRGAREVLPHADPSQASSALC